MVLIYFFSLAQEIEYQGEKVILKLLSSPWSKFLSSLPTREGERASDIMHSFVHQIQERAND